MIAEDVDKFYKKVVKDLIKNLKKNAYISGELQQNNVTIDQIQENILDKLQHTNKLLNKSIHGQSTIQKYMKPLFTNIHQIIEKQKQSIQHVPDNEEDQYRPFEQSQSIQDDIEDFSNLINKNKEIVEVKVKQGKNLQLLNCDEDSAKSYKRNSASQYSLEDFSQINEDYGQMFKKQRENCRIHMVGTYDTNKKKYNFKTSKSQMQLENVFIKVEGISRELFLKNISFSCSTKTLFE